ncbi:hypothetical protein NM213_26785 [Pseudomonas lactis]|uniref:Uncharacterized protein n=1 Tax=Pseudomonas lactis TaxID=1615674 RepID=A0A7Y1LK48_9PSED|nr:hypothetical protein [Pseudomonas lactis]MDR8373501.1 hypothetical protein [Pseudomonas lactis]NNA47523.1 hypothetical protein [Pseudomonas lactis]NNA50776.1 hypothetical protein [Pseudomonas lactis]
MPFTARLGVVIVPFSGIGGTRLERLLRPAPGRLPLGMQEKPDWVVSHGALPARAW